MEQLERCTAWLESGTNLFLSGGAGVGKTTLSAQIIAHFEREGRRVAKLASTGMAATLIGGQTLHSFLDLGIAEDIEDLERRGKLEAKPKIKKLIASMGLIVIDEISMVAAPLMDMIRLRLLQAEYSGPVLVVGDFLQLPPVNARGPIRFAFESQSWERFAFQTLELRTVYRTDDEAFVALLDRVRFADVDAESCEALDALVRPLGEDVSRFTFLYGKNVSAQEHNRRQLEHLPHDRVDLEAEVVLHDARLGERDVERFFAESRSEAVLSLKLGAPVLFTRNAWNYYNGERGRVVGIESGKVHVRKEDGRTVALEPAAVSKTRWEERRIDGKMQMTEVPLITIYQYPVTLAFAITIHKSQGMGIADLAVDPNEIFAPSQFYVALSRAVSPTRLCLLPPRRPWARLAFVDARAVAFTRSLRDRD